MVGFVIMSVLNAKASGVRMSGDGHFVFMCLLMLDLPVSFIILPFSRLPGMGNPITFPAICLIIGGLMWYGIGHFVGRLFRPAKQ